MATRKQEDVQTNDPLINRVQQEHWLPPGPRQVLLGPFRAEERQAGGQWPRHMELRGREYLQFRHNEGAARTPPAALRQTEILVRQAYARDMSKEMAKTPTRAPEREHGR
ncbi:MAG: hypothetical protein R2932_48430 [Caldilineaceae bacterium]